MTHTTPRTPLNAVIDRMEHQAVTHGSVSVEYSMLSEHVFSHNHTPSRLTMRVPDAD